MKIVRVKPPNHNVRGGFYQFRWEGRCLAVGFRFPFSTFDLRLWFANSMLDMTSAKAQSLPQPHSKPA
jgi:hypothetical protein